MMLLLRVLLPLLLCYSTVVVQAQEETSTSTTGGTTYRIPWRTPIPQFSSGGDPIYEERFDYNVGDTLIFEWAGTHNVYIHTSNSCVIDGDTQSRILIASQTGQDYVIPDYLAGRKLFFACEVGNHCNNGLHVTININGTPVSIPESVYVIPTPTSAPGLSPLPQRTPYGNPGIRQSDDGSDDDDDDNTRLIKIFLILGILFIVFCCCLTALAVYLCGKRREEQEQEQAQGK